ncbi:MAG: glycoside hydrolase family 95-like protein [bacterium]
MMKATTTLIVAGLLTSSAAAWAAETPQTAAGKADFPVARLKAIFPEMLQKLPTRLPHQQLPDGPLLGNGDMAVAVGCAPERQQFWLAKNDFWKLKSGKGGPRVFGWIYLDFPSLKDGNYRAEQTLVDGVVSARIKSKSGDSELTTKSWVSATDNLLVVEMNLVKGPALEASAILNMAGVPPSKDNPFPQISQASRAGVFWGVRGFGPKQADVPIEAACAVRLIGADGVDLKLASGLQQFDSVAPGFKCNSTPVGQSFRLEQGKPVILVVSMVSKRKSPEYLKAAKDCAAGFKPETLAQLKSAHAAWWRGYWNKSFVSLGDPFLEWRYYVSLYISGAGIRDPEFPPGIIGAWTTTDFPGWRGDYTLDYNAHAPFYGLCSANRLEQADANPGPALAFLEQGRKYSQMLFGHDGVLYPVGIGPLGIDTTKRENDDQGERTSVQGVLWLGMKSNASYCMVILSERWFMTRDLDFARRVYPLVREVATFWEKDLVFEDGHYTVTRDAARERNLSINPMTSLALIPLVMRTALDMSAALQADQPQREKWQHILANVHPVPTITWAATGKTIFVEAEERGQTSAMNTVGIWNIYPFNGIGLDSDPKQLEIANNTIAFLEQGNLSAPVYDRWHDVCGQNSWYPALVRIGYDPKVILAALRGVPFSPNGVVINQWHGIENSSIFPNTINEMLLQSHQDVLRLFPCWPKEKDAKFGTLRAYGAFLVSAEQKDGVVSGVTILSEKGRDCTLVNPWPDKDVTLVRNGQAAETLNGERFTFKTTTGEMIGLGNNRKEEK